MLSNGVTLLSLVMSGLALYLSYRASRQQQQVTTIQSATQLTLEVDKVLIDHPELRPYFYDNVPAPTDGSETANRALVVGEYMLDAFECIWDHNKDNPVEDDRDAWASYIRDVYSTSPVLADLFRRFHTDKETVKEGSGWYPSLADVFDR